MSRTIRAHQTGDVRGFMYFPAHAFNLYQMWWLYDRQQIERDLDMAASLDLNAVRFFLSYHYWREEAESAAERNEHLFRLRHFVDACADRGIGVLPVFFEPIGDEPTTDNLRDTNFDTAFAVKSPGSDVIRSENWEGYVHSPAHFVRRMTQFLAQFDNVLALEIMNEPAAQDAAPRRFFFCERMLQVAREEDEDAALTMGSFKWHHPPQWTDPPLDIFQYHQNLPLRPEQAVNMAEQARAQADQYGVPVWNTEWQRTREEPPSRFLPHYQNLAPTMRQLREDGVIDGDFFWGLMIKPAYIEDPRELGRINGVFHPDGRVYDRGDAEAIAGRALPNIVEWHDYEQSWKDSRFPFPGTERETENPDVGLDVSNLGLLVGAGLLGAAAWAATRSRN